MKTEEIQRFNLAHTTRMATTGLFHLY